MNKVVAAVSHQGHVLVFLEDGTVYRFRTSLQTEGEIQLQRETFKIPTELAQQYHSLLTRFETIVAENTQLKAQLERQRLIIDSYERERRDDESLKMLQAAHARDEAR